MNVGLCVNFATPLFTALHTIWIWWETNSMQKHSAHCSTLQSPLVSLDYFVNQLDKVGARQQLQSFNNYL